MELTIEDVARDIAGTTTELMYDTVHWQISPLLKGKDEGEEYDAIHAEVMRLAIKIMHEDYSSLLIK